MTVETRTQAIVTRVMFCGVDKRTVDLVGERLTHDTTAPMMNRLRTKAT